MSGFMLATNFHENKKHIKFPCVVQPKLDGIRCKATVMGCGCVELSSRLGNIFNSIPHINQQLKEFGPIELDGELYLHDESFQNIISGVKRDTPNEHSPRIEYHVYDIVVHNMTYKSRLEVLTYKRIGRTHIIPVPRLYAWSFEQIDKAYDKFVSEGYEGVMIRNLDGFYKDWGRSNNLQKYKRYKTEEFKIVGAKQNTGKCANQCSFICETKNGYQFKVKMNGTDAERERYWLMYLAGKVNGKLLTVKFFEWTTSKKSVPRFPIGISIRDYE